jgi:2-dehydro-3-deoxy-D-pentonate aldolase
MKTTTRHQGVVVPLVTPVTADGQLDEAAAERLVDHVAGGGNGMLVLGTTGEVASLSTALRERYVEIAVRVNAGRTPVFACSAHNCFEDAAALSRKHIAQGVDAVVGMLPNYFKLEPADMRTYFEKLAIATGGPFYLYNMPATTGMSIPLDVVEALADVENVIGMKDSEGTPSRAEEVAKRFAGRDGFALFMGSAVLSVTALRLGFDGLVPSSGNLFPTLWPDLFNAARSGDDARAAQLQAYGDKLAEVFQKGRTLGQSLGALKAALASRGLISPEMLPPLSALPAADQAAVVAALAELSDPPAA